MSEKRTIRRGRKHQKTRNFSRVLVGIGLAIHFSGPVLEECKTCDSDGKRRFTPRPQW
jgi:hypothetical protein